jgi:hypothetical protein
MVSKFYVLILTIIFEKGGGGIIQGKILIKEIRYSFLVSVPDFLGRGYASSMYCRYGPHGHTAASFT